MVGLALFLITSLLPFRAAAAQASSEIVLLSASGPVSPVMESYIKRGIAEADQRNAEAIILTLNTPGGSVGTTLNIVQAIRASDVPVIVYVSPRGAMAASAGLLITLSGHASAMAPDTAIGASSPVGSQGEDLNKTLQQKEEEYLSAQARSLAERRGQDAVTLASEAVTDARAVSASEALKARLVDFSADTLDDLIKQLEGFKVEVNGKTQVLRVASAARVSIDINPVEGILKVLTDPNIVFLLLSMGPLLILIEAYTPGGWVAGASGVICLGLALYGLGVLPINWLGLVFIGLAFVLLALEAHATSHGLLTTAAIACLSFGGVILFSDPQLAPFGSLSIPLVIGQSVLLGGISLFFVYKVLQSRKLRVTTGAEGMIGQTGRVTKDIDPEGMVLIWGERWQAVSENGQPIRSGETVEVARMAGMRLTVRPRTQQ
jgi:membrane-bound serine protease (ClpP class)